MAPYALSQSQIALYESQGYLLVRANEHKLVDPEALQFWSAEVHGWPREIGKWMPYDEVNVNGKKQLMRTENFVDYHPQFKGLLCGDSMTSIIGQIAGCEMLLFKDKINYKGPNGNGFGAHLDAPAYDHMGRFEHTTANLAVDAATPTNGCLEVVPGSHKMDVTFIEGGRIHPDWEAAHKWEAVPLEPGSILFFGSHLAHRSGANRTTKSRTMVYATYAPASQGRDLREQYYADRRLIFPPDHERKEGESYDAGWKRYGFAAPFSKVQTAAVSS